MSENTKIVVGYSYDHRNKVYHPIEVPTLQGWYVFWHWRWHNWNGEIFGPPNCPTWTDEGGCRCMLAPEEQ